MREKRCRLVKLTTSLPSWADCVDNVGPSTSHNLVGLHGLLQGYLCFFNNLRTWYLLCVTQCDADQSHMTNLVWEPPLCNLSSNLRDLIHIAVSFFVVLPHLCCCVKAAFSFMTLIVVCFDITSSGGSEAINQMMEAPLWGSLRLALWRFYCVLLCRLCFSPSK
jgi:hypothetical protein